MTQIIIPHRRPVRAVFDLQRASDDRYRHLNQVNHGLSQNISLIYFSVANIATTYLVDFHDLVRRQPYYRQELKRDCRRAVSLMDGYERAVRRAFLSDKQWINNLRLTDAVTDEVHTTVDALRESLVILFNRQMPDEPSAVIILTAAYMAGFFLSVTANTFRNFVGEASREAAHNFTPIYASVDLTPVKRIVDDICFRLAKVYPKWQPQHIIDNPAVRANRDILFRRMSDTELYTILIDELNQKYAEES